MTVTLATRRLCPPGTPGPGWVVIDGSTIVERGDGTPPAGAADLHDALLVPGFIDLQINGVGDVDFADADPGGWRRSARAQLERGTTAFCPTLITAALDAYEPALRRIEAARNDAASLALPTILGAHLEGPFLGGAPGAHPVELIREADVGWLTTLLDTIPGVVAIVTLAPEADPSGAAIREIAGRGIVVALGHSTAGYEQARVAVDAGARLVTHVFNGMGPLHHREPGLVGAALDDDRLTPSLIADLVHVHPAVLRLVVNSKPNVLLVTDAVTGPADLDAVRLADGTLAGSTLSMDQAVRNIVGLGIPIGRAVAMATTVPASVLGDAERGRIEAGARADLVALDPATLEVRAVWLGGDQVVYDGATDPRRG